MGWRDATYIYIEYHQPPSSPPGTYGPTINFAGSNAGGPNITFVSQTHGMLAESSNPYHYPPEWQIGNITLFGNWEYIAALPASKTVWRVSHPVYPYSYTYDHVWENSPGEGWALGSGWYMGNVRGIYATSAEAFEVTAKN